MDIFDPSAAQRGVGPGAEDMKKTCPYINIIFFYMLWVLITFKSAGNTNALTPSGGSSAEGDEFGLDAILSLKMPDPSKIMVEGKDEETLVDVVSWEFITMVHVWCMMSCWYNWKGAPGSKQKNLPQGPLVLAEQWYRDKLAWYKSQYTRERVRDYIKKQMTKFFTECQPAWHAVLTTRGLGQHAKMLEAAAARRTSIPAAEPEDVEIPEL